MRALLSVSDKTGLVELARGLVRLGAELYSTGGTQRALTEGGVPVRAVEELTGFPEILDGRVKTLHPAVYGGILARRDLPAHRAQLQEHGIGPIDVVVVNLYPFVQTVSRSGVSLEEALEQIDIGGPTLVRAAAKNFSQVLVVVDPGDYAELLERLKSDRLDQGYRRWLAQKAFQHVASYDTAIAAFLRGEEATFPERFTLSLRKARELRYGENPHQRAALYREERLAGAEKGAILAAEQLGGKELSFNNILDSDAAWRVVTDFKAPTVAVIKHTNPCGLACHQDLAEAYRRAYAGDPVSAYGGIVAANRPLDLPTAEEVAKTFYEIVIAPDFSQEALARLGRKRDLRLLRIGEERTQSPGWDLRRVGGGFLVQTPDVLAEGEPTLRPVTQRSPDEEEVKDLLFAWRAVKHVKSNAIVVAKEVALLGMGAGQPNRVTSVELALKRAGERARGSVLASDAFFPFPDSIELAAGAGVRAIIQPGGSIRDQEVIAAADRYGMAMVFTGVRHFRH